MGRHDALPPDVNVFERGWLSSNNVLIQGKRQTSLIDSGYCSHSEQTLQLIQSRLGSRALDCLVNTHLHSDHCGGNEALQKSYPDLCTLIPPGQSANVRQWDESALTYTTTGQECPRFSFNGLLAPGQELRLGDNLWQVHCAPGHDPHAVLLFEPASSVLISGDALWERGFGVVFPELEGDAAFADVSATLDVIEKLKPLIVIPGHGKVFSDIGPALAWARQRLESFAANPAKHARYAAKVLLKFKLLERQEISLAAMTAWAQATPYLDLVHQRFFAETLKSRWLEDLVQDLVRSGAATRNLNTLHNA
jgi:glyoxylase-like metal-dependent hydrolase (beta-lactamase superfamily II)